MSAVTVRILGSIEEVGQAEWDGLAGHHVVTTHGWLSTAERSSLLPRRHLYLVAEDERGLAGAVSCYIEETENWMSMDRVLFGGLDVFMKALGANTMPALVCGPDAGAGEAMLVRAGANPGEQRRIAEGLVREAEKLAEEHGWSLCFRNVPCGDSLSAQVLRESKLLRTPELPTMNLDLPPGGFREYRRALRKMHPATEKNISTEQNRAKRAGMVISRLEHPGEHRVKLHELMECHFQRHNQRPFPYGPEFFQEIEDRMPNSAWVYGARLGEELIGVQLILFHGNEAHLPMVGFDAAKGRAGNVYFNLCYNESIAACAAAGFRRICMGRTKYGLKERRGCHMVGLDTYVRPRTWMGRRVCRLFFPARARLLERRVAASLQRGE